MGITPLHDWILVSLDPLPEESRGGIVLPQGTSGQERVRTGTVLQMGPGRRFWSSSLEQEMFQPTDVNVGDKIAFFRENLEHQQGKQVTSVVQSIEENTGLIRANDVLYVIEEE